MKENFFSKNDEFSRMFDSVLLSQELVQRSVHIYTVIVLTKVGQKRGERPVSYRVQN